MVTHPVSDLICMFSKPPCVLERLFSISHVLKCTAWKKLCLNSFVWHSSFFSDRCYSLSEAYLPWLVPSFSHALLFLTLPFSSYVSHEVTSSSHVHSHICLFHPLIYCTWKSCPFLFSAFWNAAYLLRSDSIAVF